MSFRWSEGLLGMSPPRSPPERGSVVVWIEGPIARSDLPGLCERVGAVFEACGADEVVICDMSGVVGGDAATVDALARLQLIARRCARRIRIRNACAELIDLLDLVGLGDVLPVDVP